MPGSFRSAVAVAFLLFLHVSWCPAEDKKPSGSPPATVVVAEVRSGTTKPEVEFVGTVVYPEMSNVAAESSGRVETVNIEDGQRVKKGDLLVKTNTELVEKTLQGTIASYEEVLAGLQKARADLTRIDNLYRKQVVSEQLYDETRFKVESLEKKAASLRAEIDRLRVDLESKSIRSPFDGLIIKRWVDRGEWLQPGSVVATVAKDDVVDVVVQVPERVLRGLRLGMEVKVRAAGKETKGKIFAFVPRGDMATGTFPVKVRMNNSLSLVEGMEARVSLPGTETRKTLTMPRDAILRQPEETVVFVVINSRARMVPVKVTGYQGQVASVESEDLSPGMKVVVKGNERLEDGDPVAVLAAK